MECILDVGGSLIAGEKYGKLTLIENFVVGKRRYWVCICDCGNKCTIRSDGIKSGHAKSCGCIQKEKARQTGFNNKTHGGTHTRLYRIWSNMQSRCKNPKEKCFYRYGGRGIKVCKEWEKFESFRNWALENGYKDNLTIDRIDTYGNYCPENCRWADYITQANNTRTNHNITFNGETHTIAEWERIKGFKPRTIKNRIKIGWDIEKILTTPGRK